jgi:hypothetical protein
MKRPLGEEEGAAPPRAPPPQPPAPLQPAAAAAADAAAAARVRSQLDRMSDPEVQLIMQPLDVDSRIKFARCSKRLLRAGSAAFAWRDAPPLVRTLEQLRANPPPEQQSPLLRYLDTKLKTWKEELNAGDVALLLRAPRLREAGAFDHIPAGLLQQLQQLEVLHISSMKMSLAQVQELVQLPRLRTLRAYTFSDDVQCWELLSHAPALTSFQCTFTTRRPFCLRAVAAMSNLRRLGIDQLVGPHFVIGGDVISRIGSLSDSGAFARLELLKIEHEEWRTFAGAAPDAAALAAGLRALTSLRTLMLHCTRHVSVLLPHLHHAPQLEQLVMDDVNMVMPSIQLNYLSATALEAPLQAMPKLRVWLQQWEGTSSFGHPSLTEDNIWQGRAPMPPEELRKRVIILPWHPLRPFWDELPFVQGKRPDEEKKSAAPWWWPQRVGWLTGAASASLPQTAAAAAGAADLPPGGKEDDPEEVPRPPQPL